MDYNNFELYPIFVSLTTIPSRLKHLKERLIELNQNQIKKPTRIILNIPHQYKRNNENYDEELLNNIKTIPNIIIQRCDDFGPITKLLPTVHFCKTNNINAFILTIDDDITYPSNLISDLYYQISHHPDNVYAISGYHILNNTNHFHELESGIEIDCIEGFAGVIYNSNHFKQDFFTYYDKIKNYPECKFHDDVTISNYLAIHNIPRITYHITNFNRSSYFNPKHIHQYGNLNDALHNGNNDIGGNDVERTKKCIHKLEELELLSLFTYNLLKIQSFLKNKNIHFTLEELFIHYHPYQKHIYKNKKLDHKYDIYVSLTTIPSRIESLIKPLLSIYLQNITVKNIILNIPTKYNRFPKINFLTTLFKIKKIQEKFPELIVHIMDKDYGPASKLIGGLLWFYKQKASSSKDKLILTIDDDIIYPSNHISNYLHQYVKNNSCIVSSGFTFMEYFYDIKSYQYLGNQKQKDFLEGFGMSLYDPYWFDMNDFMNYYEKVKPILFLDDDLIFSNYLQKINIPIHITLKNKNRILYMDNGVNGSDALHNLYANNEHYYNRIILFRKLIQSNLYFFKYNLFANNYIHLFEECANYKQNFKDYHYSHNHLIHKKYSIHFFITYYYQTTKNDVLQFMNTINKYYPQWNIHYILLFNHSLDELKEIPNSLIITTNQINENQNEFYNYSKYVFSNLDKSSILNDFSIYLQDNVYLKPENYGLLLEGVHQTNAFINPILLHPDTCNKFIYHLNSDTGVCPYKYCRMCNSSQLSFVDTSIQPSIIKLNNVLYSGLFVIKTNDWNKIKEQNSIDYRLFQNVYGFYLNSSMNKLFSNELV